MRNHLVLGFAWLKQGTHRFFFTVSAVVTVYLFGTQAFQHISYSTVYGGLFASTTVFLNKKNFI